MAVPGRCRAPLQETSYCTSGRSDTEVPTGDEHRTVGTGQPRSLYIVTLLTHMGSQTAASNEVEWHPRQAVCVRLRLRLRLRLRVRVRVCVGFQWAGPVWVVLLLLLLLLLHAVCLQETSLGPRGRHLLLTVQVLPTVQVLLLLFACTAAAVSRVHCRSRLLVFRCCLCPSRACVAV